MSEIKSTGSMTGIDSKKYNGTIYVSETDIRFVSRKAAGNIEFPINQVTGLAQIRNGGMSSTVTVTVKGDMKYTFYLDNGLSVYKAINDKWENRPVVKRTRADEYREKAERLGERIQKVGKHKVHRRHPNRSIAGDILVYILLVLVATMMIFPLVFMVGSSLKPLDELFRFPPTVFAQHPTTANFSDLIVTMSQSYVPFSRYIVNTVLITFVGTFGHLIIASMAAFVLAKYQFPGGRLFFGVVTTCLMFSGYVTGIPNYLIMSRLHMIDTYWALLLPAFAAPIGLFMMKQFMEGLPTALIEAAHIDGAGEFRIFWHIVMPNVKPAWLTVIIFSVQSLWNTSASTLIYTESKKTLVYALQQIQAGGVARTGQTAAAQVIIVSVPIIIFILSQSQILETMASSGIKD